MARLVACVGLAISVALWIFQSFFFRTASEQVVGCIVGIVAYSVAIAISLRAVASLTARLPYIFILGLVLGVFPLRLRLGMGAFVFIFPTLHMVALCLFFRFPPRNDRYLRAWIDKGPAENGMPDDLLEAAPGGLPEDYLRFMEKRNGGEGFVGKNYLVLWSLEELVPFNRECDVATYVPGLFFIGSNGSGEGFGYDLRPSSTPSLVMVPFIGMGWKDAMPLGTSVTEFLSVLYEGRLYE